MPVEVTMPKFGLTMHEGTIQRLFKAAGDAVRQGEPLYEVETEKVLYEVEAPATGVLAVWLHPEGATVECGGLVAVIAAPGEDPKTIAAQHGSAGASATPAATSSDPPLSDGAAAPVGGEGGRRAISPVARKLASELGVDISRVAGTGPGGRITREDVERAAKTPAVATSAVAAAKAGLTEAAGGSAAMVASRTIPLRGMRRTIAARMHQSLRDTAQLTISTEADVTAAVELRERLRREFEFTYTDLLIQAAARALMKHPRMNARLADDAITELEQINIGVAVALEEGLIVPVVRNANRKSLRQIAAETSDLAERARAGRLTLDDVHGGTFTITNLGAYGVDSFTPILNLGETGILGIGRIAEKPVVYRDDIVRRSMLTLSLTFDHRVIDGAPAAAFLQSVVEIFNYGDR
ncbi:MAG TPA: dihydrolipoamide acetyltransferase family protein [Candidatus Binataceae bacterium]|nr:dihydrolipoamide acetyltransferase family protein [Candidatus Binataceae bacterium]